MACVSSVCLSGASGPLAARHYAIYAVSQDTQCRERGLSALRSATNGGGGARLVSVRVRGRLARDDEAIFAATELCYEGHRSYDCRFPDRIPDVFCVRQR